MYLPTAPTAGNNTSLPPKPDETANQPDVLIVEDDVDGRKILSMAFERESLRVVSAASGDAAQALLDRGLRPRVLIADINLPGCLQGGHLAAALARIAPAAGIILLSGGIDFGDSSTPRKALRINKPVSLGTLVAAARRLMPTATPEPS